MTTRLKDPIARAAVAAPAHPSAAHVPVAAHPQVRSWTAAQLREALEDGDELALLDVRDHGIYARGHLLLATSAPFWRLELDMATHVPRRATRVVLVADDDLALRAANKLQRLGYTQLHVLAGGLAAWIEAGYDVFSGTNVLGKAFGEVLEHELGTPHIDVHTLKRRLAAGEPIVVVDSRTSEEYQSFSLDGAHSLPGAELVYRIGRLVKDAHTSIVVNCAGRTRSIVGAQTLINAGLPNPVYSLKDGTMAWLMTGETLRHDARQAVDAPDDASVQLARQRAADMARRAGVRPIDTVELDALRARPDRTVFLFDVRHRHEYVEGHLPGWRWAPGGQLVQASDEYIAVRGADVVLADWDGVRAQTTGAWLAQLGFRVHTYAVGAPEVLQTGIAPRRILNAYRSATPTVQPNEAEAWRVAGEAWFVDVEDSIAYARRHVAQACFVAPSRLVAHLRARDQAQRVVIVSLDGVLAASVVRELRAQGIDAVHALAGGTARWAELGLPLQQGTADRLTGEDDTWYGPYVFDTLAQRDAKFNAYLQWEVDLAPRLAREPGVSISLLGSQRARQVA